MKNTIVSLIVLMFYLFSGCANVYEIQSTKAEKEIKIDGDISEWKTTPQYVKDADISIQANNDTNNLYFCIVTTNRQKALQLMVNGMTLWIDDRSDKNENFGIHFPIGLEAGMIPGFNIGNIRDNQRDNEFERRDQMFDLLKESLREVEIIGPGKNEKERVPISILKGIKVSLSNLEKAFCYEVSIPFRHGNNSKIQYEINRSNKIDIGIKSEMPQRSFRRDNGNGAPPEGENPRGGGRSGSRRGGTETGNPRAGRPNINESSRAMNLWFRVELK